MPENPTMQEQQFTGHGIKGGYHAGYKFESSGSRMIVQNGHNGEMVVTVKTDAEKAQVAPVVDCPAKSQQVAVEWDGIPIGFSMHNEEYRAVKAAMRPGANNSLLLIAGCGDNALNLLLDDPRVVHAVDYSPAQIAQCNLKFAAIKALPRLEYAKFIGIGAHYEENEDVQVWRENVFKNKLVKKLEPEAVAFWKKYGGSLKRGVIHCGAFESLALGKMRETYLAPMFPPQVVKVLMSCENIEQQRQMLKALDGAKFQAIVSGWYKQMVLDGFPPEVRCEDLDKSSQLLGARVIEILNNRLVRENSFIEYLFTGRISLETNCPPHLKPGNYEKVQSRLDRIELFQANIVEFLAEHPQSYDSIFLSNVGDHLTRDQHLAEVSNAIDAIKPSGGHVVDLHMWTWEKPWPQNGSGKFNEKLGVEIRDEIETSPLWDAPKIYDVPSQEEIQKAQQLAAKKTQPEVAVEWDGIPIGFSMHNEEYRAVEAAMRPGANDSLLLIAGCGDNALNLLLNNPDVVHAVDYSPAQLAQCNLKFAAIKALPRLDYAKFIGLGTHYEEDAEVHTWRETIFKENLAKNLSPDVVEFWEKYNGSLKRGVIHCGAFESLALGKMRETYLTPMFPPQVVKGLLSCIDISQQQAMLKALDGEKFKAIVSGWYKQMVLDGFPSEVRCEDLDKSSQLLGARVLEILNKRLVRENSFIEYLFTGRISLETNCPPHLKPGNYERVKSSLDRIKLYHANIVEFLAEHPDSYDSIFLSNVGDHLTPDQHLAEVTNAINALKPSGGHVVDLHMWTWEKPWPKIGYGKFNEKLAEHISADIETSPLWDAPKIFDV